MTPQKRMELWNTLRFDIAHAAHVGMQVARAVSIRSEVGLTRIATSAFHHARLAFDAYEALRADDNEALRVTVEEMDSYVANVAFGPRKDWQ